MQFMDIKNGRFYLGDCLEVMKEIPDGVVDMILCDPPYGTVKNAPLEGWKEGETHWDEVLNMEEVFNQCNRILRQNGALVLFSQDPFTYELFNKQHGNLPFAYRLTWLKNHFANPLFSQKPVALFQDLIQTYTNEGCLICDFTAGSGTTAIAAENTGRKWVCIEQNEEYATKAVERIQNHQPEEKPTSEVKIDSDIPAPEGEENGN